MSDSAAAFDLPNVATDAFRQPASEHFAGNATSSHAPRILLLYGSLRTRSYSRLLAQEAARLLHAMGAETRIYDPQGLPCRTPSRIRIRRCRNCASSRTGRRAWCGARPNVTAR